MHHISPFAMAICIMNAKVSGLMVGLNVWGMGSPAFSIFTASWSPRAAPRALCLFGKPLPFFLRLHLSVVPIGIALTSSGVNARKQGLGGIDEVSDLLADRLFELFGVRSLECVPSRYVLVVCLGYCKKLRVVHG